MPDKTEDTKPIWERAYGDLKNYLDNNSLTPGYIGAGVGAGAMALGTQARPGESPVERAKRTLKNALLGGVLGGVGTQATLGGVQTMKPIITNEAGKGGDGKEIPNHGFWHSLPARLGMAAAGSQAPRVFVPKIRNSKLEAFKHVFGSKGLGKIQLGIGQNAVLDMGNFSARADKSEQLTHMRSAFDKFRRTGELSSTQVGGSGIRLTQGKSTVKALADHATDAQQWSKETRKHLEKYLKSEGLHDIAPAGRGQGVREAIRATLAKLRGAKTNFTGMHALSPTIRRLGHATSLGAAALGFYSPDMWDAATAATSDGSGTTALPDIGASAKLPPRSQGFFGAKSYPYHPVDWTWNTGRDAKNEVSGWFGADK